MKLYFDGIPPIYVCDYLLYETSSLEECDYVLSCKFTWGNTDFETIQNNLNSYSSINKYVIIFWISDSTDKFNIPDNVILFRTSLYKTQISNNEYILPYVWEGIDKKYFSLNKTDKPIIGFCGQVDQYRHDIIEKFKESDNIECNFIIRNDFWGGNPHNTNLKNDFINNILSSHFTICNRGKGNFSMRFYQVLSCGRIPALVDSDMIFPFEDKINWKDIIVTGCNENEVLDKILDMYNNKDIISIQNKCRYIYNKYFLNINYFPQIFNYIGNITNKCLFFNDNDNNISIDDKENNIFYIFDINIYKKYNDLKNLSNSELVNHYLMYGYNENRIYKLPSNFDINKYSKYEDLINLSKKDLITHYINYGIYENR